MNAVRGGGYPRRGVVLLEVVVSLGLLITGLALVGMQVNQGLETARESDLRTRALMLVDTKFAELAAGVLEPESDDDILVGDFGVVYPGFGWMMEFEQTETDNLLAVTLTISYDGDLRAEQIANPERESDLDEKDVLKDGAVLAVAYRLWPKPADINMSRDYGVDLTELTEGGGPGEDGEGSYGSGFLDQIAALLAEYPDIIKSDGSIDIRALSALPAEEFMELSSILQMLTGGGNINSMQQQMQKLLESGSDEERR
ncbi:MAG: hypothetical protein GXY44_01090 [Phycisphaerales bacterium]|nr:hypothetical protein [Phycisphaerales bacterium]